MNQGNPVTEPCSSIQDDLKAYCDGELSWLRRLTIRRHLATCAACREEVHAMQILHEGLRNGDAPETMLAPALRERILAQVADVPPLPVPRRAPQLLQYGLAASIAVNCLFLFLMNRNGAFTPPPVASVTVPTHAGSAPAASNKTSPSKLPSPRPQNVQPSSPTKKTSTGPDLFAPTPADVPPHQTLPHYPPQAPRSAEGQPAASAKVKEPAPAAQTDDGIAPIQSPPVSNLRLFNAMPSQPERAMGRTENRMSKATGPSISAPALKSSAPALKPDTSEATTPPGGPAEPMAAPPPAAIQSPAAPAAAHGPAPVAVAPPVDLLRGGAGLGGGGFGGNSFGGAGFAAQAFGMDRGKPNALDQWPTVPPPSDITNAPPAKTSKPPQTVDADWQIDDQGHVSDIHFAAPVSTAIDGMIRDAIRRNHYLPALKNGKPVVARMSHTFVIDP